MAKSDVAKKILKGLAIGGSATAAAAGIGAGGYALGAHGTAKKMERQFSQYNNAENNAIAREFYRRGLSSSMSKKASIKEIRNAAFADEINKLAAGGFLQAAGKGLKTIARSFKSSGKAVSQGIRGMSLKGPERKKMMGLAMGNFSKAAPAAIATGIGGAGLAAGGIMGRASAPSNG